MELQQLSVKAKREMIQASGQIALDTHTPIVIMEKYSMYEFIFSSSIHILSAIFDNEEAGLWVICDHANKTKEWLLKKLKKGDWEVSLFFKLLRLFF
jgi:hypothetical protein